METDGAGQALALASQATKAARAATYFSFVVLMSFLVSLRESLRDPTASEAANCAICTAKQTDKSK